MLLSLGLVKKLVSEKKKREVKSQGSCLRYALNSIKTCGHDRCRRWRRPYGISERLGCGRSVGTLQVPILPPEAIGQECETVTPVPKARPCHKVEGY